MVITFGFSIQRVSIFIPILILPMFSSLFILMISLRFLPLFSVHKTCFHVPILQKNHKFQGYIVTGLRSFSTETQTRSVGSMKMDSVFCQNVLVMRHGERLDNFEPSWAAKAERPWDPPLADAGRKRAIETGRRLRQSIGFPIGRVFVSPFLRCVQTAVEVVASLSAVDEGLGAVTVDGDGVTMDAAEVKVSVEYGLCEMMNSTAIRPNVAPKDGNMRFDIAKCEAILPTGIVDKNVERVYKELPQWEESVLQAGSRYHKLIKDLADKYPTENLLLVTHGEGVKVAVSSFRKDAMVSEVDYCAYVQLRRPIFKKDQTFTTGEFDLLTPSGQTGVSYFLPSPLGNDTNQTST